MAGAELLGLRFRWSGWEWAKASACGYLEEHGEDRLS
jgi:hypothetical protein